MDIDDDPLPPLRRIVVSGARSHANPGTEMITTTSADPTEVLLRKFEMLLAERVPSMTDAEFRALEERLEKLMWRNRSWRIVATSL